MVVMFHACGSGAAYGQPAPMMSIVGHWGWSGVDFFFVISGFVMVYTQHRKPKSPLRFAANRALRIIPIYWILTLVAFAVTVIVYRSAGESRTEFTALWTSLAFLSTVVRHDTPVLFVGWSLEYEMLFYLIFAACLMVRGPARQFLSITAVLVTGVSLGCWNPIVIEFLLGMASAWALIKGPRPSPVVAAMALVLGSVLLVSGIIGWNGANRVVLFGIPALLTVYALCYLPQWGNKVAVALGNASYSIYLLQVFTVSAFFKITSRLFGAQSVGELLVVCCVVATTLLGYALFRYVERPIGQWLANLLHWQVGGQRGVR